MYIHNKNQNKVFGALGENLATQYLLKNNFNILENNYTCRWGELDIIAEKSGKIHFIEVKTRKNLHQGMPYEAVTRGKVRRLMQAIRYYLLTHKLPVYKYCLDVISIQIQKDNTHIIKLYENVDTAM